jgi:hypothetical protein
VPRKSARHPEPGKPEARPSIPPDLLQRIRDGRDARSRKIRRLRAAIKVGCYENNLKLQIALDRMIHDTGWR